MRLRQSGTRGTCNQRSVKYQILKNGLTFIMVLLHQRQGDQGQGDQGQGKLLLCLHRELCPNLCVRQWFVKLKKKVNDVELHLAVLLQVDRKVQKVQKGRAVPQPDHAVNYVMDSWDVANYFDVGLVPRDEAAFEDYRWDLIMQGLGPETILVPNTHDLFHFISMCSNPNECASLQRLLRSLQNFAGDVPEQFSAALGRCS